LIYRYISVILRLICHVLGQSCWERNAYPVHRSFYRKLNLCCACSVCSVLEIYRGCIYMYIYILNEYTMDKNKKKDKLECKTEVRICRIWGSHSGGYEEY
jgi:hypothetical protein